MISRSASNSAMISRSASSSAIGEEDDLSEFENYPDPTDKEGFLMKKGRGRSISFVRPWARRYFILSAETLTLSYFGDGANGRGSGEMKGEIYLRGCSSRVVSEAESGQPYSFEVRGTTPSNKTDTDDKESNESVLLLSSNSQASLSEWIRAIELASKAFFIRKAKDDKRRREEDSEVKRKHDQEKRKAEETFQTAISVAAVTKFKSEAKKIELNPEEVGFADNLLSSAVGDAVNGKAGVEFITEDMSEKLTIESNLNAIEEDMARAREEAQRRKQAMETRRKHEQEKADEEAKSRREEVERRRVQAARSKAEHDTLIAMQAQKDDELPQSRANLAKSNFEAGKNNQAASDYEQALKRRREQKAKEKADQEAQSRAMFAVSQPVKQDLDIPPPPPPSGDDWI